MLAGYAEHLHTLVPVQGRPLKVVVDAGNGMAGLTAPAVLDTLSSLTVVPMYYELDGTFPNHEANPIEPANLVDLQARVLAEKADLGLAFDGDADRCFLVDELGQAISPSALTALIADRELDRHPGATIIHNLITSRAVPELVAAKGGTPVRTRVGHSFIKAEMAQTGAVFGGEHSGHFYFREFWKADSGMLAALHALAALAENDVPASELIGDYERYALSGEINSVVPDGSTPGILATLATTFGDDEGVTLDQLDGLTVAHADWWFNVRPSNTEPLLRLNVEGKDDATMSRIRDAALAVIRGEEAPDRVEAVVTEPVSQFAQAAGQSAGLSAAGQPDVEIAPELLSIIICPSCHGDLSVTGNDLVCAGCGLAYPVRDGIPVLLVDEARATR